uniref:Ig-like domain-containing protein n=1 Tax=Neogobius melanostomus TaxID=47308 RepID=A0A8C6V0J0_9GOBI
YYCIPLTIFVKFSGLKISLIQCLYFVISDKPVARVSGYTELQTGGSVTLSCSVSPSSSGWKYEWSRNKQLFTHGSSENTAPTDSGSYSCRGVLDHTVTQWIFFLLSNTVSLTLDPNWPEVFVGETLTLRCEVEGSGDGWTYDWRRNNELLTETTRETLSHIGAAQPLADTELQTGGSVTLSCSVSPSSSGWKYEWIRNKQLFTHGSSELRVSEGGEYQCRAFRGDPPYFTELSPSFRLTTTGQFVICLCCSFYTCGFIQNIFLKKCQNGDENQDESHKTNRKATKN